MKHLPIGINTLRTIIDDDMVYVDKTAIIEPLAAKPGRYFLSRPRRFGKSLLVDTFKELFEGNEALFRGLAIHDRWDWTRTYPVIKIDWAAGVLTTQSALDTRIRKIIKENAERLNVEIDWNTDVPGMLECLITSASERAGAPAVALIDEYDKPLLDNIEDPVRVAEMRDGLKNIYSVLKKTDSLLQFVFFTGVSKFSKVSIFSGINNLKDLTLDPAYADVCGYTQRDLETDFAEHLDGVDWEQLKLWYNGYSFLGEPVYNPFDILLFISEGKRWYRNYWFETGTPTFLVKLMQRNRYFLPDLEDIEAGEEILSTFEIEMMDPITLLFQTGYLAIKSSSFRRGRLMFRLGYPNQEVRLSLSDHLVTAYTRMGHEKVRFGDSAWEALRDGDLPGLEAALRRLFSAIPWRNFTNNDLPEYEGYYGSVLYAFFISLTCSVIPEDINNHGQADLTVRLENKVYVMEIKVVGGEQPVTAGETAPAPQPAATGEPPAPAPAANPAAGGAAATNAALQQIQQRGYADKYRGEPGVQVFELGLVFSKTKRNLLQFDWGVV